ncbi:MAG: alpha/beta hydrolase [Burkholderiales bacterium]
MTPPRRNHLRDLRGIGRVAVDATLGVVDLVEALHTRIARTPVRLSGPVGRAVHEVTGHVYRTVRGVAGAVGGGLDAVLGRLVPLVGDVPDTPAREALVAALNGVLGDYLADSANPLAIGMRLRRDGAGLDLERDALAARIPRPASTILVAVHGLCMNDRQWARAGHDHAAALARDLGASAVYLHYNSGRHVSDNGREFAALLEALVEAWPVPPTRLIVVGHSMGGLVARSAAHHGTLAGHRWRGLLGSLVFLGVPHHGSPLERGGQGLHLLLEALPYAAPFARLGRVRSAGITDLRHGSVLDDDWRGRDRFSRRPVVRHPLPLPVDVNAYAVAATLADRVRGDGRGMRGDGLVPVASALGLHADPRLALAFPASHRWIATSTGHLDLLSSTAVCDRVREWLAESKRVRGTPRGRPN